MQSISLSLPYTEPEWAAPPPPLAGSGWSLEVIKSGTIVDRIQLHDSLVSIGRLPKPHCTIDLEHPSISRFHAVLQFSRDGHLFLYDLGSTHGSCLNKKPIVPKTHTRVHVDDVLSFGSSSRLFVVHGPPNQQRLQVEPLHDQPHPDPLHPLAPQAAPTTCSPSPPSSPVRVHVQSTSWSKDPRKALSDWLDARGLTLDFDYTHDPTLDPPSATQPTMVARIHIPLDADDPTLTQSHIVGQGAAPRKRDAERAALADALTQLDALGLLATRAGESAASARVRRMLQEADAAAAEDDDDLAFYDRTRERERERAAKPKKAALHGVQTFESLSAQLADLTAQRQALASEVQDLQAANADAGKDDDDDALDAYMRGLDREQASAAVQRKQAQLADLDLQLQRVQQLVDIARPAASSASATVPPPQASPSVTKKRSADSAPRPSSPNKRARTTGPTPPVTRPSLARDMGMDVEAEVESDDDQHLSRHEKSVEWVPPKGQSGDGRTALNDKLGY